MVPEKTVERLLLYRDALAKLAADGVENVYSKRLAELTGRTAAQVRRDIMTVGYSGNPNYGYNVVGLHRGIGEFLELDAGTTLALAGVGNLGRAILRYFSKLRPRFEVVGAFDADAQKTGRVISGCHCHPIAELPQRLSAERVDLGILTVPDPAAQPVATAFVEAGVSGLINFTSERLTVPARVFVEDVNLLSVFDKAGYFSRLSQQDNRA